MIQMSTRFIPRSHIDNKSVLVQAMAWRRTGAKPLPEPLLPKNPHIYLLHSSVPGRVDYYVIHPDWGDIQLG